MGPSPTILATTVLVAVVSAFAGVWLWREVRRTCETEADQERLRTLEEQRRVLDEYRSKLLADEDEIMRTRRQVADELERARASVEAHDGDAATEGLSSALRLMGDAAYRYCDHPSVDAMATMKARACREQGVDPRFAIDIPRDISVSAVDLCAVVGNLVDNGLEAALRCKDGLSRPGRSEADLDATCDSTPSAPYVSMRAAVHGDYLVVAVENPLAPSDFAAPGSARSFRRGSARRIGSRGWGLSIVSSVAARYGGELSAAPAGNVFRARAVLRLNERSAP